MNGKGHPILTHAPQKPSGEIDGTTASAGKCRSLVHLLLSQVWQAWGGQWSFLRVILT